MWRGWRQMNRFRSNYLPEDAAETERQRSTTYKEETERMMWRALALLFPGGEQADPSPDRAAEETRRWLEKESVVIYEGVVEWDRCRVKVPVLLRKGKELILVQLYSKLWRERGTRVHPSRIQSRSLGNCIRETAKMRRVVEAAFPGLKTSVRLFFSNGSFRAGTDLYEKIASGIAEGSMVKSLFVEVDADEAVGAVLRQLENKSERLPSAGRRTTMEAKKGDAGSEKSGERKTGEQNPGEGRRGGKRSGVEFSSEGTSPEKEPPGFMDLYRGTPGRIAIGLRKKLQEISSRGGNLPLEWIRGELVNRLRNLRYPLHFIDFEAASSPIPLRKGNRPYQPVYFHFSCHTLHEDGRIRHRQWLNEDLRHHPHVRFAEELISVPDLSQGSIIQYSPFEKQTLQALRREFEREGKAGLRDDLNRLLQGDRFIDLKRWVQDWYYNRQMNSGLGLKGVLHSTLQISDFLQSEYGTSVLPDGEPVRLVREEGGRIHDPWRVIQLDESIGDGESAMHAWLYTRTPWCPPERSKRIRAGLRRYGWLDTLAMVMIFRHWQHRIQNVREGEDVLLWE